MSSTRSEETEECALHSHDSDEETSACTCGLIRFKRSSQVFDYSPSCSSEIIGEEDLEEEDLFEINISNLNMDAVTEQDCEVSSTVFSLDFQHSNDDVVVYVAVGHGGDSSMEALSWALKNAVTPSNSTTALISLIHVFPQVNLIPSPLGKIPRSRVNLEHVNHYLTQVKGKRKLLLQKYIDLCLDSKVKVEMMLIESDNVAEAIVELVGKLDIRKLVIGTTTSNLRKSGSRRRKSIAAKVMKKAQERCDVKIICEGREVMEQMIDCSSRSKDSTSSHSQDEGEPRGLVPFMPNPAWLFKPRFLSPR